MGHTETVYLPGGDRLEEVRLSTSALAALQGAIAAATVGQLTTAQANDAIAALQAYISVSDTEAMKAGREPAEIVRAQKLDAADAAPLTLAGIGRLGARLSRHEAEAAIHLLAAAGAGRLAAVRHSDAAEPAVPTYSDFGQAVFEARERWIETGSPEDRAAFDAASRDFDSRVISLDPACDVHDGRACPVHFDSSAKTRTSCDCGPVDCSCSLSPSTPLERKCDMSDSSNRQPAPWERPLQATAPSETPHLDSRDPAPWLRPLSETVPMALSKDTAQAGQRHRAHLDSLEEAKREDALREQLHAPIRERERKALFDAVGALDACAGCEMPKEDCVCKKPADPGKPADGRKGQRSLAPSATGTPPWKQPLQLSSDRARRLPSAAMRFQPADDDGGGDAA